MKWIATKKQLPPVGKNVLIFTTGEYYHLAHRIVEQNDYIFETTCGFSEKGDEVFSAISIKLTRDSVVCWADIPKLIVSSKKKVIKKVSIFELMDI